MAGQLSYFSPGVYSFSLPYDAVIMLYMAGGGGGGGGKVGTGAQTSEGSPGGGGGGFGVAQYSYYANEVITITIGAGGLPGGTAGGFGTGAWAGGNGGATIFGSYFTCTGGLGGYNSNPASAATVVKSGGAGGTCSGNFIYSCAGGNGGDAYGANGGGGGGLCLAHGSAVVGTGSFVSGAGGGIYPDGVGSPIKNTANPAGNLGVCGLGGGINIGNKGYDSGSTIINSVYNFDGNSIFSASSPNSNAALAVSSYDVNMNPANTSGDSVILANGAGGGKFSGTTHYQADYFVNKKPSCEMLISLFGFVTGCSGPKETTATRTDQLPSIFGGGNGAYICAGTQNTRVGASVALIGGGGGGVYNKATTCSWAGNGGNGGFGCGGGGNGGGNDGAVGMATTPGGGRGGDGFMVLQWEQI